MLRAIAKRFPPDAPIGQARSPLHFPRLGHLDEPTPLANGALLHTESVVVASWPHRQDYALTHYVTTPCGGCAVPMVWQGTFGSVLTRLDAKLTPALWLKLQPALQRALADLRGARLTFEGAVARLRAWLAAGGLARLATSPAPTGVILIGATA